ncbi:hypothetical protein [Corallococcus llansteffanensis]|uniref:Uncharacterized protein n=1 Tax=Corallococcus llansteffanensis TaxID=2316731 RepID=A0A3A8Q6Q9_9BACT|nr:hypothetical protein [Corallococcus llansteffanensis]RKH58974.1 hypothetical protein D7V93_15775 [Corallococcus llansteffanensis]
MQMVLRSMDVVLQNNTNELLTLESAEVMRGEWGPPAAPRRGDVVEKQSSAKWLNQSTVDGVGVMGFLRLGCTKGYIDISWNMPYFDVGQRTQEVKVPPPLDYLIDFNTENFDQVVMMVTLVRRRNEP